ncbi:MAG: hypothetical protein HY074_16135 [Deltaproteobacteria bacterium]|nr:hypothetical protein [Deltaproteobacteria bacterium]
MNLLAPAVVAALVLADSSPVEFRGVSPQVIGTPSKSRIVVEAFLNPNERLIGGSLKLYLVGPPKKTSELAYEIVGDPLCTLLDNGDSRNGDQKTGDNIFSCLAVLKPERPGPIKLVVRAVIAAKKGSKSRTVEVDTKVFSVRAIKGTVKVADEHDSVREKIMIEARRIWGEARAKYGKNDRAQAMAVRGILELEGVAGAALDRSGDVFVDFRVGGRDQIFTFEPKQE